MSEFFFQLVKNTPVWVWAILAALIALGARQLRERTVKRFTVLIAPAAFMLLGLVSGSRAGVGLAAWAAAFAGVAAFTHFVLRPTGGARYEAEGDRIVTPGSVVPMLLMLSIFVLNYAINVTLAIHPEHRAELAWQVGPALIMGVLSGVFAGRAATLFRMNRGTARVVAA